MRTVPLSKPHATCAARADTVNPTEHDSNGSKVTVRIPTE
jgi:hypothetical protein